MADASSCAAARKSSLGTAGHALPITPTVCNYAVMAENDSLYNTAPTYSIYLTGLVMDWVLAEGGVDAMNTRSDTKARMYVCVTCARRL